MPKAQIFWNLNQNPILTISNLKIEEFESNYDQQKLKISKEDDVYFLYLLNQNDDIYEYLHPE